ncbi:Putative kelch-type beta propeller [Septoria linicola]|uniref:Kelch-type beta propeller n=1 Tax=Septoria linicola TaxID=215465 RepID=A0A9Q9EQR6_9PEZI|nr:putative kelch-type beta propeller [Septoria linicola]USW59400.1 Putative kelch-type beta propeller [Septoria linicola]
MAEAAAIGGVIAYEVAETTVQVGAAGYAIAKPTLPLKASFSQIATAQDDETRNSVVRSDHSVTVVKNKAYIFGGETGSGKLASNDIHAVTLDAPSEEKIHPEPDYLVLPAVPDVEGQEVPKARTKHAATHFNVCVAIFGGVDQAGKLVDEEPIIWLYVTAKSAWESLKSESGAAPPQRSGARLFNFNNNLVLYGGVDGNGGELKDVWHYSYSQKTWTQLPSAPISTRNAALVDGVLYLISGTDNMSSDVHSLHLHPNEKAEETIHVNADKETEWSTVAFPTNPLTPGPRPRVGGGLLPITTGYGRNYLLYFFGARQNPNSTEAISPDDTEDPSQWSDTWTYQIPSSSPVAKPTLSISEALKPAHIKDVIREKLGYSSGEQSWAEIEVEVPGDLTLGVGKIHPGPRANFGYDVMPDGCSVVVWGGLNAKGEREGDGWTIRLS